jgi:DNA-binding transcriptional LysR family regulator
MQAAEEHMNDARRAPSGALHVSLSLILGPSVVPALSRFAARYPKVTLRLSLSDRVSKLQEEQVDVALRIGVRDDSTLVQKRLLSTRWVTLASPAFVARQGAPRAPSDLHDLNCLRFVLPKGRPRDFTFRASGSDQPLQLAVSGNLLIDHGQHLLEAALAGLGVAQVLDFMAHEHLENGALTELLPSFSAVGPPVCSVAAPPRHRSPNVRAFNAFLGELFKSVGRVGSSQGPDS